MIIPEVDPLINLYPCLKHDEDFDAWDVMDLIFSHFTLNEVRQQLWDMYNSALYDDSANASSRERSDLSFFFTCLNDLATAAYVVARKKHLKKEKHGRKAARRN